MEGYKSSEKRRIYGLSSCRRDRAHFIRPWTGPFEITLRARAPSPETLGEHDGRAIESNLGRCCSAKVVQNGRQTRSRTGGVLMGSSVRSRLAPPDPSRSSPETQVTLLARTDFRAVRAPASPNRSTSNHN